MVHIPHCSYSVSYVVFGIAIKIFPSVESSQHIFSSRIPTEPGFSGAEGTKARAICSSFSQLVYTVSGSSPFPTILTAI